VPRLGKVTVYVAVDPQPRRAGEAPGTGKPRSAETGNNVSTTKLMCSSRSRPIPSARFRMSSRLTAAAKPCP